MSSKHPVKPRCKYMFQRRELGQPLHLPNLGFDLTDPHCHSFKSEYNSLHDPHLKNYFQSKTMHKRLVSEGYITKENKVKCSLQQYNQYNDYIDRKMAQLERQTMDEQNVKKRIEVINRNNAQTMKKIREREQYKQHLLERMEMNWQENNLQMLSHMNEMTQQDTKKPKPKKKKGSSKQ